MSDLTVAPTTSPALSPQRESELRRAAQDLEAAFLAEMLRHGGLGASRQAFGGGVGEDQFASLLRTEHARALAESGGIGLAESLFNALAAREGGAVTLLTASGVDAVEHALARLEQDLRSGRLDRLDSFAAELARGMERLASSASGAQARERLPGLRDRAARAATMVQAALSGLRDARALIAAPKGFTSYDASGQTGMIAPTRARVERRR